MSASAGAIAGEITLLPTPILAAVVALNRPLEGSVPFLYKDSKSLPTIGVGLLIPNRDYFYRLPLVRKDTQRSASMAEKAEDWAAVAHCENGEQAASKVTQLELTGTAIVNICNMKLAQNHERICETLGADFVSKLPWDMVVCLHSMAYAMGPGFFAKFPKFTAALRAGDYATDAIESDMPEGEPQNGHPAVNPGVHPRNVADGVLCRNAAFVVANGMKLDRVYWPDDLAKMLPESIAALGAASG